MKASRDDPLENVLERAIDEIDKDEIAFGDILDLFGDRSFGPIIVLLALLTILPPLGAIPLLPAAIGLLMAVFSMQILFGADHIWVPRFIEERSISRKKLKAADQRAKPWLKRIDRLISRRMDILTRPWSIYVAAIFVTILGLLMIPLELVPFAVAIPGTAILFFGLAFVARDGVLMLIGYTLAVVSIGITGFIVPWGQVASWFS